MILFHDVDASVAAYSRQFGGEIVKLTEDLERYLIAISTTKPEVLVECGTWTGGSARWFAKVVPEVITIDITPIMNPLHAQVRPIIGHSADPSVVETVRSLVGSRRTMVVLDSDHHAANVRAEIEAYGPLVSPGCYLVIEDGILRWIDGWLDGPLDAIEALLVDRPGWRRDQDLEQLHPITMFPAGWWQKEETGCAA